MNQAYKDFLVLSEEDRNDVFGEAAIGLGTSLTYVEKDFWVCLALDILYNGLPHSHPRLLFKGGTSLSKGYDLIQRFSEDVDFAVFRCDLGFSGSKDPASAEISGKKRQKISKDLQEKTSEYICGNLRADLETTAATVSSGCNISVDLDDDDRSTLLFQYPSLFESNTAAYIQPRVKLEGGGRSALCPHKEIIIKPFIADVLTSLDFSVPNILTIAPERTFWDKVMILHGWHCRYRDEKQILTDPQRISRHYYDVAMIFKTKVGQNAVNDSQLREDVRDYTMKLFKRSWMKLGEAIPGSMKLVPEGELRRVLEQDYQAMQGMMLGEPPNFDEIIELIKELEYQINNLA